MQLPARMNAMFAALDRYRPWSVAAFFLLAIIWRSPHLLLEPRLWAEEGPFYFAKLQGADFSSTFTLVVRGNFQLLINWITYAATIVPARFSAHVTTYLALGILLHMAYLFGQLSRQRKWPLATSLIAAATLALMPQGYEVFLSATNVQWVCSVSVLTIALLNTDGWSPQKKAVNLAFILAAGLTGVCSAMLAPFFLIRLWVVRSAFHVKAGGILALCVCIHAGIIASHPHAGRSFTTDPYLLTFPALLQSVASPLLGAELVDKALAFAASSPAGGFFVFIAYVVTIGIAGFALLRAEQGRPTATFVGLLFATWITTSTLNTLGALGDPRHLVSGWGGGRYYLLGAFCFVTLLASAASQKTGGSAKLAFALLTVMAIAGISQRITAGWKDWMVRGESWQKTVDRCQGVRPCTVHAWPGGADWSFELRQR